MYQKHFTFDPHQIPNSVPTKHNPIERGEVNMAKLQFFNQMQAIEDNKKSDKPTASYWNTTFIIAFLPLLLWGFPIHLLFLRKRINTTREWLKYLCPCSSPCISLLTILMVLISFVLNVLTAYIIGYIINALLIDVYITTDLINFTVYLVRILPVIITQDMLWIQGYKLKKLVGSFDRFTQHWNPTDCEQLPKVPSCRAKLAVVYLLVILIHVLHFVTDFYSEVDPIKDRDLDDQIWSYMLDYSIAILFTCALPLYCTFCWAVKYEVLMVQGYITILIGARVKPTYAHFDEFKKCYRKIADDILTVNSTFSIVLSIICVLLGIYIYSEAKNLALAAVATIFRASVDETISPSNVRIIVANFFIILLYVALFGMTIWQAVGVNDEVRLLHVCLNDFVTEPESRLSVELHEGFSLLKWYIHSRLEQQKPALLSIMLAGFIPGLRTRLVGYNVRH